MRKELITHFIPKAPESEMFRNLRTNIQFMNANKELKTIMVTSTMPGEGKKLCICEFGCSICSNWKKSCFSRL